MATAKTRVYGQQLIIDGYDADVNMLGNVAALYEALRKLPRQIGMRRVGFPHLIQFKRGDIAGLSGFVFIMESHISVHTYAKQRFISIDIYSCKPFDATKVLKIFQQIFGFKRFEQKTIPRGKRFPVLAKGRKRAKR